MGFWKSFNYWYLIIPVVKGREKMEQLGAEIMCDSKKIFDIKINEDFCMESLPCQHYVDITYENGEIIKSICMDSICIESLLISLKKEVPEHFKGASENEIEFNAYGLFD